MPKSQEPSPDAFHACLVAAAVFVVFLPALQGGFVWDDQDNLVANHFFHQLNLRWMFTTFFTGPYQPLSWLSYWMDYQLWGLDPTGYHFTNAALHAANAALFFLIARRFLPAAFGALAALFFAVHPLRVESVAWATERRDVLSGFFYLLTVLLYLKNRPRAALAAFVASLLSKGMGVSLPFVLLILEIFVLGRKPDLKSKLPFFAAAFAAGALGVYGQAHVGAMERYGHAGLGARALEVLYGLNFYLLKTLAPVRLMPLYQMTDRIPLSGPILALLTAGAALALRRRQPEVFAAWACYALTLAPVLGFAHFGLQIVADRYSYLSCLGLALLAAAGLSRLRKGLALGAAAVLALAVLTWRQCGVWRDEETLWRYALSVDPGQSIPHNKLGVALVSHGRVEQAAEEFRAAVALDPSYAFAHNNLGRALATEGKYDEAIGHFREAIRLKPDYRIAHGNLGQALAATGKIAEAKEEFRLAR